MEKTGKKTGKRNPPLHTRFKKGHIPTATSEQKKAGRARRKQAQETMNYLISLLSFTPNQLKDYLNKENILVKEYIIIKYVLEVCKGRLLVDFLNRFVPYIPRKLGF